MICPECGTRLPPNSNKCHFCGNDIFYRNETLCKTETTFLDKFVAVFTVLALIFAISAFFYTYLAEFGNPLRAIGSLVFGFLAGISYILLGPILVKNLIDPILKREK